MKNLLLFLPAVTAASGPPGRVGSVCGAGGSLVTRPASIGATLGRLRSLRTKDGAASPSSSSSSAILTSRRRFGAWLVSVGNTSIRDGSTAIGLFPATLSLVVGAGRFWSSSLLVYWGHRGVSPSDGSIPAGWSIPGASDTYTEHRSISPICNRTNDKSSTKRLQYSHSNTNQ